MNITQVRCHGCDRVFSPRGLSQHLSKNSVCRATQAALKTPSVFQMASRAGQTSNSVSGDRHDVYVGNESHGEYCTQLLDRHCTGPDTADADNDAADLADTANGNDDTGDPADATDADVLEALSNIPSTASNLERDHRIEVQTSVPLESIEPEPEHTAPTYSTGPKADSSDGASQLFIDRFPHGSPGAPIPGACQGSSLYHSSQDAFRDSDWAPFSSQCDWEIAHWAKMRAPTSSAMEDLLAIPSVCVYSLATIVLLNDCQRLLRNLACRTALQKSLIISLTICCLGAPYSSAVNLSLVGKHWSYTFATY